MNDPAREYAASLLETAVSMAKDPRELADNINLVSSAAQHILAVHALNLEKQGGENGDDVLEVFLDQAKCELQWLRTLQLERTPIGGGKTRPTLN